MGKSRQRIRSVCCAACTRPAGAGFALCQSCGDRTATNLAAVVDLHSELQATYAHWDAIGVMSGRGGELGLPFAVTASLASTRLVDTVVLWARAVAVARLSPWSVPDTLGGICTWLIHRLDWLRALEAAGDAYAQIDEVISRARSVIDRPMMRTTFLAGPCPEIRADSGYCSGQVFAYIPTRIGVDPALLRCRNVDCQRHENPWTPEQWRGAGVRILRRRDQIARARGSGGSHGVAGGRRSASAG